MNNLMVFSARQHIYRVCYMLSPIRPSVTRVISQIQLKLRLWNFHHTPSP